nr:MAG TPA: hypothetical protein [Bacteriophage sp.]
MNNTGRNGSRIAPDGMWKTAEAETLARTITLWEEA